MNGPQYYREAERLLHIADKSIDYQHAMFSVAMAHVCATLALTAATVSPSPDDETANEWTEATS